VPPFVEDDLKVDEVAWEDGLSNDIIILGKRYPLVKAGNTKIKRVRNYEDDPTLDFNKEAFKRGIPFSPVRPRKGKPQTMEDLKKTISFVVIHTDLAKHARQTFSFLIGRDPTPLSTHFCINWNGVIYQYADVADRTAHGGETNDITIGIDMNLKMVNMNRAGNRDKVKSFNRLRKAYKNLAKQKIRERSPNLTGKRLTRELEKYEFEQPRQLKLQGSNIRAWGYTPAQYDSLILLLKLFVRELDLEKSYPMTPDGKVIPQLLADDDLKMLKGFIGHWHLSDQRWDPGPAFDWERVLSGLQNEYNWFPLVWDESMILQGRDVTKASEAAWTLMRNTESARLGGTFPMGPNQTWHGGVHLFPPQEGATKKYPVHAMFDGEVVAAHFEQSPRVLGHNNFVLLKHEIDVPDRKKKVNEDGTLRTTKLRFYTLYMHLDSMKIDEKGASTLAEKHEKLTWVKRLWDLESLERQGKTDELDKAMQKFEKDLNKRREEIQNRLDNGERIDERYRELVVDLDAEAIKEDQINKKASFLTVGKGTAALVGEDQVALIGNDELKVKVSAGEWLGFTGLIRRPDGEGYVRGVHVEVLGTEETVAAIDMDVHADHFRTPQRARGSDLTVRTEDILLIFRDAARYKPYRGIQLWPDERIDPDEIIEFYASSGGSKSKREAYREQLRRSITYHVSEWSDQVDWIEALTGGNDWSKETRSTDFRKLVERKGLFSNEIKKFLPFIWLNKEVAEALELVGDGEWDGRIYHIHPIHWVMWVTYNAVRRNRVFRTSVSLRDLRRRQARARAIRELVGQGRVAKAIDDRAWQKYLGKLDKALQKRPFYLTAKKRKRSEKLQAEFDELRARVINAVSGDFELDDHDASHGIVDAPPPVYSNPDEVLRDLYDLPPHKEWEILRNRDDG